MAVNCVGSAMSEAVLNMEEAERDRPKPKEPPRLLIGMSDVRVKIGTDIQFYAKGWFRLVLAGSILTPKIRELIIFTSFPE